jgi:hypothetical protein
MMPIAAARVVNAALYQAGWFACVLGGASGRPWLGAAVGLAAVLVHLALVERRADEARLVAFAALAGTAIDSAQQGAGTVSFPSGHYAAWLCPIWLTVLWAQFATLPGHGLAWLAGRPIVSALLGAIGGPLAFLAGERLGGVSFPLGRAIGCGVLAVVWAAVCPLLMSVAARSRAFPGRYRWPPVGTPPRAAVDGQAMAEHRAKVSC